MRVERSRATTVVPVLVATCLVTALFTARAHAQSDADLEDATKFIASRPELASLVGKVATKVAPGSYQLALGASAPRVMVVKQGAGWAVAVPLDTSKLELGKLIPGTVLGDARVRTAVIVVSATPGTLAPASLGATLQPALTSLGGGAVFAPGVTLFTQLEIGNTGTLGQLKAAGVLPTGPVWITGSTGEGLVGSALAGAAPTLDALDFSLALALPSTTPAPFNLLSSPKLTFGPSKFTFARTGGAFQLSGEQTDSKLVLGAQTFAIPRTRFTFTAAGGSYDVRVEGSSTGQPWRDAFGLDKVDINTVSVFGTISSTKTGATTPPIKGFGLGIGAKVSINKKNYDGEVAVLVENNALKEFTLRLGGELNLGFLPGGKDFTLRSFALAITPGSGQAALAGELSWRSLTGRAAVVLSRQPMLFLGLKNLDLMSLVLPPGPRPPGLPTLPPLDVLLAAGFGANAGEVTNLPSVAQNLIDEITGATGGKVKVTNGLTIVTRVDAAAIGADKLGTGGKVMLAGSIDVMKGSFRIAASMPSVPTIPGLPAGFSIEAPELFVALAQKGGTPVGSFGLAMRLRLPVDRQVLVLEGSMALATSGTFSFTGSLLSDWDQPLGLVGIKVLAPVIVTVGVSADATIDLGFQAGMKIGKQTYNPMAMCLGLQPAPIPVPKKFAIRFKGSELGPRVQVELMQALVGSITNGPLKNSTTDPATRAVLAQVAPSIGKLDDDIDALGVPMLAFKNVDVALTTPGVTCDLPAIEGVGIKLVGTATLDDKPLGALDAVLNLTRGFAIKANINDFNLLGVIALKGAMLDVLVPMPGAPPAPRTAADDEAVARLQVRLKARKQRLAKVKKALANEKDADDKADLQDDKEDLQAEVADLEKQIARGTGADPGHFYLNGRAQILRASAALKISIDKTGAEFRFKSELADLGSVELTAATEGESMAKATDFIVGLAVDTEGADKLLANLGTALKASAATRKQAQAGLAAGTADAQKALQAEHDRLDAEAGKDFRAAKKKVKKTRKKFKKAERALARAKDKCKEDLGPAWRLCDVMDAAEEAIKVTRRSFKAAEDTLDGIQKSTSYVRLQAVKASLAAIKAGKSAADAAFSGWSAVDKVGQMVVEGGELIEIEGLELTGSLRQLKGTLAVTASVGGAEVTETLKVDLTSPTPLDLVAFADKIADEITTQAAKEGSPVYKALRARK